MPSVASSSSGWDTYYIVFLSAILALAVPALMSALSWALDLKGSPAPDKNREFQEKEATGLLERPHGTLDHRMNTRFFLAANAALVIITLALALVPCISTFAPNAVAGSTGSSFKGLIAVVSVATLAALGLLYSARKGDLSWLKTFQSEDQMEGSREPKKNGVSK
jgi:NADH:ubiquinone oxidoreductase subunit 3 (subunit A)